MRTRSQRTACVGVSVSDAAVEEVLQAGVDGSTSVAAAGSISVSTC